MQYTRCTAHHATRAEALECVARRHRERLTQMDADLAVWWHHQQERLRRLAESHAPPDPPPPELLPAEWRERFLATLIDDVELRAALRQIVEVA